MTTPYKHHASSVVPAQLSFLAIYNPTLGPTDETFADQLVFWYSRKANEVRRAEKNNDAAGGDARRKAADKEEENERLRQIGLAQGMVGFARTFSDNEQPVDAIETEKSRIVLKELENGWWILASIDLTQLPAPAPATTSAGKGKSKSDENAKPVVEYSSREVSSSALLVQQLLQAHWVFLLHHGPTLDELFVKQSRAKFCSALERYWSRFARSWDVILNGNPAVDALGGIKLAAGGELGVGVGEEEWGSGEREVLEDLTRRTEGLVDVVVSRFGEPAPPEDNSVAETETLPWLGSGNVPSASDGVVFAGLDKLNRPSVRSISLWMRQIYAYGDYAYGVRDNPSRERRKRRRRAPPPEPDDTPGTPRQSQPVDAKDLRQRVQHVEASRAESPIIDPDLLPRDDRPPMHDRVASHDHATGISTPQSASYPQVPPPIVSAAEHALDKATKKADSRPHRENHEQTQNDTTMGIPDQYMKYMTFGLSSLAKSYNKKPDSPRLSPDGSKPRKSQDNNSKSKVKDKFISAPTDNKVALAHVDPFPEGEQIRAKIAEQVQAENQGNFVIGLKGNLSEASDEEDESMTEGSFHEESGGSRIIVRTLQVRLTPKEQTYSDQVNEDLARGDDGGGSGHLMPENPATINCCRLRVLIYIRRPFMFAFLFEPRSSSLSYAGLYKSLHNTLKPIHNRLLASTSPQTVAERLQTHLPQTASGNSNNEDNAIFSLLYDPARLSLHSNLPNIPPPGSYDPWTRLEALNVHASILASLAATAGPKGETALERTSKTARGWWVVWLRLPPSVAQDDARPGDGSYASPTLEGDSNREEQEPSRDGIDSQGGALSTVGLANSFTPAANNEDTHRVAFLVRKAGESSGGTGASSGSQAKGRLGSGMWSSLGMRAVSGGGGEESSAANAAGGLGGFGIDARRYVEGLLSLNR